MTRLFPPTSVLYLHETALDLYLSQLQNAFQSLPREVLQLEYNCHLVVTDFTGSRDDTMNSGIVLGWGYHSSDFPHRNPDCGIVFMLNPPYVENITDIRLHFTAHEGGVLPALSTFKVNKQRFMLSRQEFDLDTIACGVVKTGNLHKKYTPERYGNTDIDPLE